MIITDKKNCWKAELKALKYEHIKQTAPDFFELSGGYEMKLKRWNDKTANGLTRAICDYLNYSGCSANRISCVGMMRKINGKMQWTHGNTRKGTADIHAIVRGRHVSIEVKIGKDRMSADQEKEMDRVTSAGGLYFIARDMQSFVDWYKETFKNINHDKKETNAELCK